MSGSPTVNLAAFEVIKARGVSCWRAGFIAGFSGFGHTNSHYILALKRGNEESLSSNESLLVSSSFNPVGPSHWYLRLKVASHFQTES